MGRCWGTEVGTGHLWARDGQLGSMGGTRGAALGLVGAEAVGVPGEGSGWTHGQRDRHGRCSLPSPPSAALLQVCNFTTVPKPGTAVN